MARNKYPEETIKQILDVSFKLFIEKGYDQTTIQDIVNNLGMSKGAIYHHFKSKEEIMNAISKKNFEENVFYTKIYNDPTLNGLQKIKKTFIYNIADANKQTIDNVSLSIAKNPRMVVKHLEDTMKYVAPMMAKFIEEGIKDESINAINPKVASEAIMLLFNFWLTPAIFMVSKEEFLDKLKFLKDLTDKIGIPFINDEFICQCVQYYENIFNKNV
ncbi:TetR/AcrR family transcriptional regulator [Clostridium frigidicarnis]|uniref:DNA-binding transcriptional regulator, AcrR family n=1 Tax=Clostridium frigidicarnis TaxID=84698 RepID=A0A1I0V7N4_9CLOT|nr:TetR/AcrR family transcriptional regulator [Clostridium frigidicarnis]SFA72288.1 DNA-binding transcriptional regulator, AcrR family [Clostridium frigidicarnis]